MFFVKGPEEQPAPEGVRGYSPAVDPLQYVTEVMDGQLVFNGKSSALLPYNHAAPMPLQTCRPLLNVFRFCAATSLLDCKAWLILVCPVPRPPRVPMLSLAACVQPSARCWHLYRLACCHVMSYHGGRTFCYSGASVKDINTSALKKKKKKIGTLSSSGW